MAVKYPLQFVDGDIDAKVSWKGEHITCRVSSHALMLASPIWKLHVQPFVNSPITAATVSAEDREEKVARPATPGAPLTAEGREENTLKTEQARKHSLIKTQKRKEEAAEEDGEPLLPSYRARKRKERKVEAESGDLTVEIPKKKKSRTSNHVQLLPIDFTKDDPDATLVLLAIAHIQFELVPRSLSYKTLLALTWLCRDYDCWKLVQPWLSDWLKDGLDECRKPNQEGWMFISWYFGREDVFESLAQRTVRSLCVVYEGEDDGDGMDSTIQIMGMNVVEPYELDPRDTAFDSGILSNILKCREKLMKDMLDLIYDLGDKLVGVKQETSTSEWTSIRKSDTGNTVRTSPVDDSGFGSGP